MYGTITTRCIRCYETDRDQTFNLDSHIKMTSQLMSKGGHRIGTGPVIDGTLCDGCYQEVVDLLLAKPKKLV